MRKYLQKIMGKRRKDIFVSKCPSAESLSADQIRDMAEKRNPAAENTRAKTRGHGNFCFGDSFLRSMERSRRPNKKKGNNKEG